MATRRPQVLIVSNDADAHVPLVAGRLEARGTSYFILNTETFGVGTVGSARIDEGQALLLASGDSPVDLGGVSAIWFRRPEKPLAPAFSDLSVQRFIQHEQAAFLDGLLATLDCVWLSHPSAIREAGHKLRQLVVAKQLGFVVPPTLVTQSPDEVRAFRKALGVPLAMKVIAKGPPREPTPEEQYVIFTQRLTDADLEDDRAISACASLYQPYIEKKFELRVTVVGQMVFACRIDSQVAESTRVDWRNYDLANTPHTAYELPPSTRQRFLDLVQRLGLNFGAIDMICTPDDRLVFLEINPNGQWGWIEELTGLEIADAHAAFLSGCRPASA